MLQRDLLLKIEPENTPSPSALLAEVIFKQVLIAPTHTLSAAETTPKVDEIEGSLL
jgi:hypothetical protein